MEEGRETVGDALLSGTPTASNTAFRLVARNRDWAVRFWLGRGGRPVVWPLAMTERACGGITRPDCAEDAIRRISCYGRMPFKQSWIACTALELTGVRDEVRCFFLMRGPCALDDERSNRCRVLIDKEKRNDGMRMCRLVVY